MRKGDKVRIVRSELGDDSLVGKTGFVHNIHRLATGEIKITIKTEDGILFHLDSTQVEVITE